MVGLRSKQFAKQIVYFVNQKKSKKALKTKVSLSFSEQAVALTNLRFLKRMHCPITPIFYQLDFVTPGKTQL